ncbi:MAG: hypothetical protein IPO26_13705 [Saprospiraceae bacterium]|nr:hypothetical protein [Saprospiraceae bacterium]
MTGLRVDHFGDFGWKATPRCLVRADISPRYGYQIFFGKGYRIPHLYRKCQPTGE